MRGCLSQGKLLCRCEKTGGGGGTILLQIDTTTLEPSTAYNLDGLFFTVLGIIFWYSISVCKSVKVEPWKNWFHIFKFARNGNFEFFFCLYFARVVRELSFVRIWNLYFSFFSDPSNVSQTWKILWLVQYFKFTRCHYYMFSVTTLQNVTGSEGKAGVEGHPKSLAAVISGRFFFSNHMPCVQKCPAETVSFEETRQFAWKGYHSLTCICVSERQPLALQQTLHPLQPSFHLPPSSRRCKVSLMLWNTRCSSYQLLHLCGKGEGVWHIYI